MKQEKTVCNKRGDIEKRDRRQSIPFCFKNKCLDIVVVAVCTRELYGFSFRPTWIMDSEVVFFLLKGIYVARSFKKRRVVPDWCDETPRNRIWVLTPFVIHRLKVTPFGAWPAIGSRSCPRFSDIIDEFPSLNRHDYVELKIKNWGIENERHLSWGFVYVYI